MLSIQKYFEEFQSDERQLRDFIDLDATFRAVNGEQEDFDNLQIKDDQIFGNDNVEEEQNDDTKNSDDDQEDFETENSDDNNELSDLSILEKEESLKPQDILTIMFSFKNIGSYKSTNILAVTENDRQDIKWENYSVDDDKFYKY